MRKTWALQEAFSPSGSLKQLLTTESPAEVRAHLSLGMWAPSRVRTAHPAASCSAGERLRGSIVQTARYSMNLDCTYSL